MESTQMGPGAYSLPTGFRILLALLFIGFCVGRYLIDQSVNQKEKW